MLTSTQAYATLLRLYIVTSKLARAEATSAATGQPLPDDFESTLAGVRHIKGVFGVELQTEAARRRFRARS
jgi:hypothetical protein